MNMNKLTQKSQEALQDAHSEALDRNHQEVDAEHLLLALLDQENGLVCRLLQRAGAPPADVRRKLEAALSRRPRLSGGVSDVRMARSLHEVLVKAEKEADRLKDEFVSVEHLALAILAGDGEAAKTLQEHGVGRDGLLRALSAVRGNQRVTSANPEDSYEALEKYGVDLVAQARAGKLDPVIGRDGEIRRVIRILSRKTKNNPRPDRRARSRQDRGRRGPGPAHRARRRPGVDEGAHDLLPRHGGPDLRRQVPR